MDKYSKCVKDCKDDFECEKLCEQYKNSLLKNRKYSDKFYILHPEYVYRDSDKKYKKDKFDGKLYD